MKKLLNILVFLSVLVCSSFAQINRYGIPFITNYTTDDYSAESQNWCLTSDNRGVLYFGNNFGVLEYDGVNWTIIEIPNKTIIRSLATDSAGTVFVGGSNEFGYLSPDKSGKMVYNSLSNNIDSTFKDIWKIFTTSDAVYFGSKKYLFKYDYDKVEIIGNSYKYKGNLFFFVDKNNVFLGNYSKGLLKLKNNNIFSNFLNSSFLSNNYVTSVNSINKKNYLISTFVKGIYKMNLFNGIDTLRKDIPAGTNNQLQKSLILNATKLSNQNFAFSTNNSGIIITDDQFNIINFISNEQYLQDNVAYDAKDINKNNLWATLNNGISKIEINSPFRFFDKSSGYEGSIYDIIEFKNNIYIATNLGAYVLFYDDNNHPKFKKITLKKDKTSVEAWNFTVLTSDNQKKLLLATNFGAFFIDGFEANQLLIDNDIKKSSWSLYCIRSSKFSDSILYLGLDNSFIILNKKQNKWQRSDRFFELEKQIRSICEDDNKNIWLGTHYSGIIKIDSSYNVKEYGLEQGLPVLKDPVIKYYEKNLLISTPEGLYTYSKQKDSIVPYNKFSKKIKTKYGYYQTEISENKIWLGANKNSSEYIIQINDFDDSLQIINIPYKRVDFKGINALCYDSKGILWIGTPDALYSYNTNYKKNYNINFNTLIRKVYLKNDSILFNGTFYSEYGKDSILKTSLNQHPDFYNILEYKNNTIIFEWAATFYEDEKSNKFSYKLDGFDDQWSKWTSETKYVFTNLPEGEYIFYVKAKNKYGIESSVASYKFTILPPWYRTIFAYIAYILLSIILILLIIKWYTRKLKRENIRLEKIVAERTKEIRLKNAELQQQKEEIETQRDEIEAQRDLLLDKNQEIEEKNENINASILYASRIQRAILPPKKAIDDNFSDNFILFLPRDIVSGDFFWFREQNNSVYVVAADCTGHGVPGAFMSMLGVSLLNEIVEKNPGIEADSLLNKLRDNVIKSLHQKQQHTTTQDGMDLSLIIFDKIKNEITFAGANNPLLIVRNKKISYKPIIENLKSKQYRVLEHHKANLVEIKADKMPIGIYIKDDIPFKKYKFKPQKDDVLYILSDGFPDQFGGEKGQKYMIKNLKKRFIELYDKPLNQQNEILKKAFFEWINYSDDKTYNQTDDVIILAVKI